jgi:uncharacterized protein (DUF3084 family)
LAGGDAVSFSTWEFNWQLIVIIVGISAVVSYVGDVLGMRIGKRRISLLGLRPRYTSTVITMFTGVSVAILTLVVASYTSESVRAAFFGVNYLEREIARLIQDQNDRQDQLERMEFELLIRNSDLSSMEGELKSASNDLREAGRKLEETQRQAKRLEDERFMLAGQVDVLKSEKTSMEIAVATLRRETDLLKKGLAEMKEGRVIAFQGELLAQTAVESGAASGDIDAALSRLIKSAEETILVRNKESGVLSLSGTPPKVVITEEEKRKVHKTLAEASGRKLLRLTAPSNVVFGQTVSGVADIFDSKLVFQKGDVLLTDTVNGGLAQDDASDVLYTMLKQINPKAVAMGVLPDPLSGAVGNLDTLDFYEVVDRISESKQPRSITFLAANDIYTEGPVDIRIVLGDEY